jgi:hypothetical protein
MSANQQLYLLIAFLLSTVIGGNYLIHVYYKKRQKNVEDQIGDYAHEKLINIKVTQTWYFGIQIKRADIILIENQMVIFFYNPIFMQAQPIITFNKSPNNNIINIGLSGTHLIDNNITLNENEFAIFIKGKFNPQNQTKLQFTLDSIQKFHITKFIENKTNHPNHNEFGYI